MTWTDALVVLAAVGLMMATVAALAWFTDTPGPVAPFIGGAVGVWFAWWMDR